MITGAKTLARAWRWLEHRVRRGRVGVVLLYHQVAERAPDPGVLAVSPRRFAEHMALLATHYTPLDLGELVARARAGSLPPGAVAVTFDDGYASVLHRAAPVLDRHAVPATCFVVSGALGGGFDWEPDPTLGRPLDADELRRLAEQMTIGAHTISHPSLRRLDDRRLRHEVEASKAQLEACLGRPVDRFAYPFGQRRDIDRRAITACRAAGYELACTAWDDAVGRQVDPWQIGRLWAHDVAARDLDSRLQRWLGERAR